MRIYLNEQSPALLHLCKNDNRLANIIHAIGPISYETNIDSFSFLTHEIIEQMLSKKASAIIYSRLERLCDGDVSADKIVSLRAEEISMTGISSAKIQYIKGIASSTLKGELDFRRLERLSDEEILHMLTAYKGIGAWTAKMYLIFVLDRQDVLPIEDGAFKQAYKWLYQDDDYVYSSVVNNCSHWKPYSSIAARYLYRALDSGFTKQTTSLSK